MFSYEVQWLIEKRVVFYKASGAYDPDGMQEAASAVAEHVEQGIAPVHLIIDLTDLSSPGIDFRATIKAIATIRNPARDGCIFMISSSPVMRFFGVAAANMLRVNFRLVATLTEALQALLNFDASLQKQFTLSAEENPDSVRTA
jgi:hypothetical protein